MTRLHFIHIPKTAGCSVRSWLRQITGVEAMCPARDWDEVLRLGRHDMSRYNVFSGHYGLNLVTFLGGTFVSAAVLRNPVDRTFSHYRHVFRDTGHKRHAYVSRQAFEDFVLDSTNWPMIENFQARYFMTTPVDFGAMVGRLDTRTSKARSLSVPSEDARSLYDDSHVIDLSISTLESLDVLRMTETLDAFLHALAAFAPGDAKTTAFDVPRKNVAPPEAAGPVELSDRGLDAVRGLTEIDHELHEIARAKVMAHQSGRKCAVQK